MAPELVNERDGPPGGDRPGQGPLAFRHTYGRNCVLKGVPIPVLQKWLGHQSLKDTQRYVELAGAHHEWVSTTVADVIGVFFNGNSEVDPMGWTGSGHN